MGCKVIHENVSNFKEVYELLNKKKMSSKIKTLVQAKSKIINVLEKNFSSVKNIKKLNLIGKKILIKNQKELNKYIL